MCCGIYNFILKLSAPYMILFAQFLGASGFYIGLLSSLGALLQGFASLPIGAATERYSLKKIMLLGFTFDITAMIICILARSWYELILAFIFYRMIKQLPLADLIFITFTEPERRVTIMGLSRLFFGTLSFFALTIATAILSYSGGIRIQSISLLFYISLIFFVIFFFFSWKSLKEVYLNINGGKTRLTQSNALLLGYKELARSKNFSKWIALRVFRAGSLILLTTFTPLWLFNIKGITNIGTLIAVSTITSMLLQIPMSRLADVYGKKKIFYLLDAFYCSGILMLVLAPTTEYLILASVFGMLAIRDEPSLSGGIGGLSFTPFITMWWESVPEESMGRLFGVDGILIAMSQITFSVVGGILWDQGFNMLVLLIPLLIEVILVIPLLYTIPEIKG